MKRTVRIIDRSGWGNPITQYPQVISVSLDWTCPECGGPRGEPGPFTFYEEGASHTCDRWVNPCGHVDKYTEVSQEHRQNTQERLSHERHADPQEAPRRRNRQSECESAAERNK